jgi:uncharacterized protein with HEPN domain
MSGRDPRIALKHMRDHAREALDMIEGRTRGNLDTDRMLSLALVRLLEIVDEAATRVPKEARPRYPAIPWRQLTGLRNRLIHGYDSVDLDILWSILTVDLKPLVDELDRAL